MSMEGYTGLKFLDVPHLSNNTELSLNSLVSLDSAPILRANLYPNNDTCYNIVTKVSHNYALRLNMLIILRLTEGECLMLKINQIKSVNCMSYNVVGYLQHHTHCRCY